MEKNLNISYDELSYFLGSRCLTDSLKDRLIRLEKNIDETLYKGLPFPKQLLKVESIVEEWYGSNHWSPDKKIAIGFSSDYINEEYVEELQEEIGEVDMIPIILWSNNIKGVETYKIMKSLNKDDFVNEKEITVIGYNFVVRDIKLKNNIYFVKVEPVKIA